MPEELAFSEVTSDAGLAAFQHHTGARGDKWMPETMGSGAAFLDYDGDGWLDILLVGGGSWKEEPPESYRGLWLYQNKGDGTFVLRSDEAGLAGVQAYGFGVTAADYNNDGHTDVFLTTLAEDVLLRNEGDGTFTDVTADAGLSKHAEWSTAAMFFDADRDGHLDLYVGNYIAWSPETDIRCTSTTGEKVYCTPVLYEGLGGRFYRNSGNGTFTEQTEEAGIRPASGKTLGVAEMDFNRDGWPDLAVANDIAPNLLYVNENGRFKERGMTSGIALDRDGLSRSGMGIDAGVVDSTGRVSLFVGNFSRETIGVFRHRADGLFEDRASASHIAQRSRLTLTFGLFLFDPDMDGDMDLFAANGHIRSDVDATPDFVSYRQFPHLFMNRGDGTFEDRAGREGALFQVRLVARGAAYGDYDRDGDQDVLVTENGGGARLWRNDSRSGHVLQVRLEGHTSNRDGLGTAVVAVLGDKRARRRSHTGSSYLSQSETDVMLGLGSHRSVDSLIVHWPSGQTDRFVGLDVDQSIRIREGDGITDRRSLKRAVPPL